MNEERNADPSRDDRLNRIVALKMILAGQLASQTHVVALG